MPWEPLVFRSVQLFRRNSAPTLYEWLPRIHVALALAVRAPSKYLFALLGPGAWLIPALRAPESPLILGKPLGEVALPLKPRIPAASYSRLSLGELSGLWNR